LNLPLDRPLKEVDLCVVAAWHAASHKVQTLPTFLSAVACFYRDRGWGDLPRGQLFEEVRAGVRNAYLLDVVMSRRALSARELSQIVSQVGGGVDEAAFVAALCVAFAGCLRIHEYVGGALMWGHVEFTKWGLRLVVLYSKKSLQPVRLCLSSHNDVLCPVRALARYRDLLPAPAKLPEAAVFCVRGRPMTAAWFVRHLRASVVLCLRVNASVYAGHSLRAGGTTDLLSRGVSDSLVLKHGRWTSVEAMRRYVRLDEGGVPTLPAALRHLAAVRETI
jgi:hypothetical protein